eukprot:Gregarina_sp_Poly_1__5366@NODE_2833_length_1652_cov_4_750789_g1786_i0_p1_GENE_NODE_2833_length_1652_cov_4_750789_g1786_i0NODE_2833_length_1652_cov_4_750789_g1786_i0_p1_ORF_typecomplete_len354_score45_55EutK_C/PF16365_5/1_2e04EutK_C/PF16365_5/0_13WPP/PF13943_6/0_41_NODE_2833_length_1652_cov_4_750789_g1786_i0581119
MDNASEATNDIEPTAFKGAEDATVGEKTPTDQRDMEAYSKRMNAYIKRIIDMTRIKNRNHLASVFKKDNILIAWTEQPDSKVEIEMLLLTPVQYEEVKRLTSSISDADFAKALGITSEKLTDFFVANSGLSQSDVLHYMDRCKIVVGAALVAKYNKGFSAWLRRVADENHPFFRIMDHETLPRGLLWTKLAGVPGEVPFNGVHKNMIPTALDNWFYVKNDKAHPIDKRNMRTEIDVREHKSRLAILLALVKRWSLQVARPADNDKDYFYHLASEIPHPGHPVKVGPFESKFKWDASLETARMLNDVMEDGKLRPACSRVAAMNFLTYAPQWQPTMYSKEESDNELLQKAVRFA